MNAFAVAGDGVPLGLIDQIYWIREKHEVMPKNERTARNQQRPFEEKECANLVRAAESAIERLSKRGARVCVVIDREADNTDILFALNRLDCDFIVRAQYDRKKISATALSLRETLGKQPVLGRRVVDIGAPDNVRLVTPSSSFEATESSSMIAPVGALERLDGSN